MKNQCGAIKTNLELYRAVMGGSGGYRRLTGGSAHFLLQTNRQTLHHNIYIITITHITIHHTGPTTHHHPAQLLEQHTQVGGVSTRHYLAKEYVDSILQGLSGEVSKLGIEKDQRAVSPPAPHIHRRPDRLAGLVLSLRI